VSTQHRRGSDRRYSDRRGSDRRCSDRTCSLRRRSFLSAWAVLLATVSVADTATTHGIKGQLTGRNNPTAFYCTNPQQTSTVQGDPHVAAVPSLESVGLVPASGGLTVSFRFREPIVFAPEGVYISWTVFVYRHRSDASNNDATVRLQFQDRGKGWQPTGWTILAAVGLTDNLLGGQVHTNKGHNELTAFFPGGFANLSPPFYWFASQEEYRAYLPRGNDLAARDWNVYGGVFTDCPGGVRPDPDSSPYAAKLLSAPV
jgi:hypothetical protein